MLLSFDRYEDKQYKYESESNKQLNKEKYNNQGQITYFLMKINTRRLEDK